MLIGMTDYLFDSKAHSFVQRAFVYQNIGVSKFGHQRRAHRLSSKVFRYHEVYGENWEK